MIRAVAKGPRQTLRGQLRDLAVATVIALIAFTGAFVVHRNQQLIDGQIDLARRAALGEQIVGVRVERVAPPQPAADGYLRVPGRGGPRATDDDKPIADAAIGFARAARSAVDIATACAVGLAIDVAIPHPPLAAGDLAHLVPDGSGRAIAVRGGDDHVVVALTGPATLEPYPWLVVVGVLGLGLVLACAGALIGRRARAPTLFVAAAALAIPSLMWGQMLAAIAIAASAGAIAFASSRGTTDRIAAGFVHHRVALGFLAPTLVAMIALVATPFVIGLVIGFFDHHHGTWTFVGLDNFAEILSGGGRALDDPLNFWFILGVTVLWTFANVVLHVVIGVSLALLLSRTWLRGKGVWRMLLILPWAIPNYITALIWRGMFEGQHSAINSLLDGFGFGDVSWFSSWATAFSANVVTNTWLGFPFMMVVAIGAIQGIPRDLYEAAEVDGATSWQRFRHITLPHLRPAMAPAIALGSIWTFNMFNVIFLVSGGRPGGSTDILVTDAYRWAFERGERYGMAAAYAIIIFLILLLWTVFGTRVVRRDEAPT
jgi:ABC-type sugar transport system permease subunit